MHRACLVSVVAVVARLAAADEIIYQYEATTTPYHPSAGWIIADACDPPCSESVQGGRFRLSWAQADNLANYHYWISQPPQARPPTLWVEWRFRSNHPLGPNFTGCDGEFSIRYRSMLEPTNMYGDAAISNSGPGFIEPLPFNEFHTYRYESADGQNFRVWANGKLLTDSDANNVDTGFSYVQLRGYGGCISDQIPNMVNEWDYVRYGTISDGARIVAVDPPAGVFDPGQYTSFDRFAVTFDAPNFVPISGITVEATGGVAPAVTFVRRRDNDGPETFEVVLDHALPPNERTRFTFTDGSTVNIVEYDYRPPPPPIPAVSGWGIPVMAALLTALGCVIAARARRPLLAVIF
ncbi:MAG: hypothetical protein HY763_15225 [Planctomycetes bacterium]|nr:hypothetical protein [Planctomycetota bacterium]